MEHSIDNKPAVTQEPRETSANEVPVAPSNHKPRKFLFPVLIGVILVSILGAISWIGYQKSITLKQTQEQPKKMYHGNFIMSTALWPGYIALHVAKAKGYFKEEGVDFDFKQYVNDTEETKDYESGKIQARGNINFVTVQEGVDGFNHQAVLVIDYSNGGDGIIAAPGITDVSQLKGKKVGYEFGETMPEYFVSYALQQNNLTMKDIVGVNLNVEQAPKALLEKKIDAAFTYEPYITDTLKENHGNKIYLTSDAPGSITDVMTISTKFIQEYPDTVAAILRAYFKGLDFYEKHPQESYQIFAKEFNTTPEEIQNEMKGVTMLNLQQNKVAFTYAPGLESLYGNFRIINNFIQAQKNTTTTKQLDTDTLVNGTFIKNLNNQ